MKNGTNYFEDVAGKLIALLEKGSAPWQKPWAPSARGGLPYNAISGRRYKGINSLNLLTQARQDPRWMTFNQAKSRGAHVRKDEHGTLIQRWIFADEQSDPDGTAQSSNCETVDAKNTTATRRAKMYFTTVFNAEQVSDYPPFHPEGIDFDPIERAETIMMSSGAKLLHDQTDSAFYAPALDQIHLPPRRQFFSAAEYYSTVLHELGHWTGHASRLNREILNLYGSEEYAFEELCAEIASMMLGDELCLGHDPSQHAAYVGSWIRILENDPKAIFKAANSAEKIRSYILNLEQLAAGDRDDKQVLRVPNSNLFLKSSAHIRRDDGATGFR